MKVRMRQMAILSLIILAAGGAAFAADTAMRIQVGEKAPEFRLPDLLTGKMVSLSEFKGRKVVMIEFWATWCEICVREAPELGRLYAAWKEKGFELLSVAVPPGDGDGIRRFVREHKLSNPTFLDEDLYVAAKLYGLTGPIPLKVVIDHKGIVRYAHVGGYPPGNGELSRVIGDLVKEMKRGNGRTASRPR
ncbi:MAG: TlpA disulfide reductase family protein [Candidatus Deferrimicrobiaceae bacterium]